MQLHYLIFDRTDEDSGRCSFDALASVLPPRLPALLGEIETVLRWAGAEFGTAASCAEDAEWDYALHATLESHAPVELAFDARTGRVAVTPGGLQERLAVSLTLTGTPAFCDAFRDTFGDPG